MKKILFLFLLCFQFSALSQELRINAIGTKVSIREISKVKQALRFQNAFYRKQFGGTVDEEFDVKVFGDYSDFYRYANNCCRLESFTTAFFIESKKEIVVFKNEEFLRSFSHEISHALTIGKGLHKYVWLDEGLAEVLSSYQLDDLGQVKEEVLFITDSLKIGQKGNRYMTKFLAIDREEWSNLSAVESYGLAWALVNYLYKEEPELLTEVLRGVLKDISPSETIAANYDKGLKIFFRGFRKHYRNNRYTLLKTRQKL